MHHRCRSLLTAMALLLALPGCSSLLPDEKTVTRTPWTSYAQAQAMFDAIVPGKTTEAELHAIGIAPGQTPNVALVSHADLLRRLQATAIFETASLDPALQDCVAAREACFAYQLEQRSVRRERVGNFLLDFLSFKRTTNVTGWQFEALVLINHGRVAYKSWSGKPGISEVEQEVRPLGPLQGFGSALPR